MWKLQRNCFIAYSLQIICKHKKKQTKWTCEDEIVEEQCGFRKGRICTNAISMVQQIIKKKERTQLTAISFIYWLR